MFKAANDQARQNVHVSNIFKNISLSETVYISLYFVLRNIYVSVNIFPWIG